MNSIKRFLGTCGLGLMMGMSALALQAQTAEAPAVEDVASVPAPTPATYTERSFDENKLAGYRSDARYQYQRDKPEPPKRKPKPRKEREYREVQPVHYSGPRADFSGFAKGILWVLIIGAVLFVLFQLLKVNWSWLLRKRSDKAKVVAETEIPIEEDLSKMEIEDLLQTAIDAGRYRVAVRMLYLRALRQLSDQSLITWRQEKTNHDYLREIKDRNLRPAFSDVTLIFEYIWYGEFPVNKDDFNLARASFIEFEQTMRLHHAV